MQPDPTTRVLTRRLCLLEHRLKESTLFIVFWALNSIRNHFQKTGELHSLAVPRETDSGLPGTLRPEKLRAAFDRVRGNSCSSEGQFISSKQ